MKVKLVNAGEFGPLYMEYVPDEPEPVVVQIHSENENRQSRLRPVREFPTMADIAKRFPEHSYNFKITKVDGGHIVDFTDYI